MKLLNWHQLIFLKFLTADFGFKIFIIVATVPTGCKLVQKGCKCTFQGVGGHLGCNPKVMQLLNWSHFNCIFLNCFGMLILDLNIFIIVATVPTGLQTCAKRLQMHLSGGGGTPCLQPKSNETFKLASTP